MSEGIHTIIIKRLSGEALSTEEEILLQDWVNSSPHNQEVFSQLQEETYQINSFKKFVSYHQELDEHWNRLQLKLKEIAEVHNNSSAGPVAYRLINKNIG